MRTEDEIRDQLRSLEIAQEWASSYEDILIPEFTRSLTTSIKILRWVLGEV